MCFSSKSKTTTNADGQRATEGRYFTNPAFVNFMSGYNAQYSPENFAETQEAANINPMTIEAANQMPGVYHALNPAVSTAGGIATSGLTPADINRYQSGYTNQVVDAAMQNFNEQNATNYNLINANAARQGALRNTNAQQAKSDYYANIAPGQMATIAGLRDQAYARGADLAKANLNARLAGAGAAGSLAGQQMGLLQGQFNMGDAMRNAGLQKSMIPYQLYNQGLAGQGLAGQLAGINEQSKSHSVSTTENTPSGFSSAMGILGTAASLMTGGLGGALMAGLTTSVMPGTAANGGWSTTTQKSPFGFKEGGGVPAVMGPDRDGDGRPDPTSDMLGRVMKAAHALREFRKSSGGGIAPRTYAEGGGEDSLWLRPGAEEPYEPRLRSAIMGPQPELYFENRGLSDQPQPPLAYKPELPAGLPASEPPPAAPPADYRPALADPALFSAARPELAKPIGPPPYVRPDIPATPPAVPYTPREIPNRYSEAPTRAFTPGYGSQSLDDRPVLQGGLGRQGGWGGFFERFGRMAMAGGPPETQRMAATLGDLNKERMADISGIRQQEKDYADATGIYQGMDTLKKKALQLEADQSAEQRRLEAAKFAELQRHNDVQIGSTKIGDEEKIEKLRRMKDPSITFADREAAVVDLKKRYGLTDQEAREFILTGDFPKATKTPETAFETGIAGASVKDYEGRQASISANSQKLDKLAQMRALIEDPRVVQGPGSEYYLMAKKVLGAFGVSNADGVAEAEAFRALANQFALELRNPASGAGMPGAMSDADRMFLLQSTPGLTNTRAGNLMLTKLMEEQAGYKMRFDQAAADYIAHNKSNMGLSDYMKRWVSENQFAPQTVEAMKRTPEGQAIMAKMAAQQDAAKKVAVDYDKMPPGTKVPKVVDGKRVIFEKGQDGQFHPLPEGAVMPREDAINDAAIATFGQTP